MARTNVSLQILGFATLSKIHKKTYYTPPMKLFDFRDKWVEEGG